jgi:hypothetical protein
MLYYNCILNIDDKKLHENTAEASEYIIHIQIHVNIVLFPLHVSIPVGSSSGGPLIHLKLKTTVTKFAKLSGLLIRIHISVLNNI